MRETAIHFRESLAWMKAPMPSIGLPRVLQCIRCLQVAVKINAMARTPRGLNHVSVLYLLPVAEL